MLFPCQLDVKQRWTYDTNTRQIISMRSPHNCWDIDGKLWFLNIQDDLKNTMSLGEPPYHDDIIKWIHFPRYWLFVLHRWGVGMNKQFHPTHYWKCDYVSMLGLKSDHINKLRGPQIFSQKYDFMAGWGARTIVFDNFCMTYDASWWWILTFVLLWELCTDTMFTEWLETFESGGKKIPITTSYLLQFSVTNNLVIRSCDNVSMLTSWYSQAVQWRGPGWFSAAQREMAFTWS